METKSKTQKKQRPTLPNIDSFTHVRGQSLFVDDMTLQEGTLHAAIIGSTIAHGYITQIDYAEAEKLAGVIKIFTANDIRGENQIGGIIPDEPLFAEKDIHFWGQPIGMIIAESDFIARKARSLVKIQYEELPVITTAKEAKDKGQFVAGSRTFQLGDCEQAFKNCEYIFEGETFSNGQEHLYLETQGAYAVPMENGNIKITSSTQGPTAVQRTAARVLGIPMHKIEVEVIRLGGGFGGKEDQATPWAVMAALATQVLNQPVKLVLNRHDDLHMTGKRHPYESSFKIGLNKELKIMAYQAEFLQNAGAAADLSPAIAERTLFHSTNAYFVPNVQTSVYQCKTNLPPNTAFRGFGGPQGMYVIESAIALAAREIGVPAHRIQEINLLQEGDEFSYGQIAKQVEAQNSWQKAKQSYQLQKLEEEVAAFNKQNDQLKKGLALMPIAFGISFTNTRMNHARALVHIYEDGSVGISTAAVEMGQGVNTKMLQIASEQFGLPLHKVKLEPTNTTRVANTSPSAASATADLNGKALQRACKVLKARLCLAASQHLNIDASDAEFHNEQVLIKDKPLSLDWYQLVTEALNQRICLSENSHYATPEIHFDKGEEKGHPFAYHVYGTAIITCTLDCIRGRYNIDAVQIVHDYGQSMNEGIDLGQVEGGLAQGIGWMTMEEIAYGADGRLHSNALSTYKVPDLFSTPDILDTIALDSLGHEMAIKKSKAVGEPPLMYGIGVYFAIQNAISAFNPKYTPQFNSPMTPEKALMSLYEK